MDARGGASPPILPPPLRPCVVEGDTAAWGAWRGGIAAGVGLTEPQLLEAQENRCVLRDDSRGKGEKVSSGKRASVVGCQGGSS